MTAKNHWNTHVKPSPNPECVPITLLDAWHLQRERLLDDHFSKTGTSDLFSDCITSSSRISSCLNNSSPTTERCLQVPRVHHPWTSPPPPPQSTSILLTPQPGSMGVPIKLFMEPEYKGFVVFTGVPSFSFLIEHPPIGRKFLFDLGVRKDPENFPPRLVKIMGKGRVELYSWKECGGDFGGGWCRSEGY